MAMVSSLWTAKGVAWTIGRLGVHVYIDLSSSTANLRTKIMDFRGFDSSIILILTGGIPRPIGDFPGKFESSNLSRDNVSREIGRMQNRKHFEEFEDHVSPCAYPSSCSSCDQDIRSMTGHD